MSLWAEHTGIMSPNFNFPADLDCVREMKQIGTINWNVRHPRHHRLRSWELAIADLMACWAKHRQDQSTAVLWDVLPWPEVQPEGLYPAFCTHARHSVCLSCSMVARCQVDVSRNQSCGHLQVFAATEVQDMQGHLMVYPYLVSEDGVVSHLGSEMIPDTKTAKVRGASF